MATQIETKVWKCQYCNKVTLNHGAILSHEESCKRNPKRCSCGTCVHACKQFIEMGSFSRFDKYCDYHKLPFTDKPWEICADTTYYGSHPIPGSCAEYEYKGKYGYTRKDGVKYKTQEGSKESSEQDCSFEW